MKRAFKLGQNKFETGVTLLTRCLPDSHPDVSMRLLVLDSALTASVCPRTFPVQMRLNSNTVKLQVFPVSCIIGYLGILVRMHLLSALRAKICRA